MLAALKFAEAVQSIKEVICEQFIDFLNDALALVQLWEGFS